MRSMRHHWPVALLGIFAVLRVVAAVRQPGVFSDSPTYGWLDFLGGQPRLWTVPLIYNLLPTNAGREAFQILLGIVAWSCLALSVRGLVRSAGVGVVAMVLVLALGLTPHITVWDATMLSESIATSVLVLLIACLLRLRRDSRWLLAGCLALVTLWVFSRQQNVVAFLAIFPFAVGLAFWRLPRRRAGWTAVVLVGVAAWSGYSILIAENQAPANHVWTYNAVELVMGKVAGNPPELAYMQRHGMPISLVAQAQRRSGEGIHWLYANPTFMRWVDRRFQPAYESYLLAHPVSTVRTSLASVPDEVTIALPSVYGHTRAVLPSALTAALWGTSSAVLRFELVVALCLLAVAIRRRSAAMPLVLIVLAAVLAVDTYSLSTEYYRLFLPVGLLLRLAIILSAALGADVLRSDAVPVDRADVDVAGVRVLGSGDADLQSVGARQ